LKRYETVFIVQADLPEDDLNGLIERYTSIVTGFKGLVAKIEKWGKKRLAYEIRKQTRGFYVLLDYAGKSTIVNELERNFKIDDKVLKFMTVVKSEDVNLNELEADIEARKEKAAEVVSTNAAVKTEATPQEKE
jgi:small subunit ribosomal protein S6